MADVDASFCSNRYIAQLWIRPGLGRVALRPGSCARPSTPLRAWVCAAPLPGVAAGRNCRLLRTKQQLAWLCEMPPTRGYPHRLKGRHESPNFRKPFYLLSLTGILAPPRDPNNNNDEDEEDEDEDEEDDKREPAVIREPLRGRIAGYGSAAASPPDRFAPSRDGGAASKGRLMRYVSRHD